MTSLEHVSVGHALDRISSWTGDEDVIEVWGEVEVEEVSIGLAVTTADEEDVEVGEGEEVGVIAVIGDKQDRQRVEHGDRNGSENEHENKDANANANRNGNWDDEGDQPGGTTGGVGSSSKSVASRRSCGMMSLRRGSVSRTRSGSHSHSNSNSLSFSRSRSSVREGLEMGESSVATSWTQADVDAEESGSGSGSGERPSGEAYCRSSADRPKLEEDVIDVGVEEMRTPRGGTEVMSLSYLHTSTSTGRGVRGGGEEGGGDVSRKEEVLVVQEEDIGEVWHPLRYTGKARSQDQEEGEGEKGEGDVGVGSVDVGSVHALESIHGGDQSLEMNEKERGRTFGSSGRNTRHLHLEFKQPSPQPWDETDPPTDNNEAYTSDYYSTLNSKKFGTLQKSRRRPLIPHSSYYFGPPPPDSSYGTSPVGQLGVHHPREIVRIERDYVGGELIQFTPVFPLELEGRITPTQFHQTINDINEILISAHSIQHGFVDNLLAVVTLHLSTLVIPSHYTKEMRRLKRKIEEMNTQLYNPVGLHILWPQKVAFLFLEIEYY